MSDIWMHLSNMRIIYLHPLEEDAIKELKDLRNQIHLTRVLIDGDNSNKFDYSFVDNILRLYYVSLNQSECYQYYWDKQTCLKEWDGNYYDEGKKQNEIERIQCHTDYAVRAFVNLYETKPMPKDDFYLKMLSSPKSIDYEKFSDFIGRFLMYEGAHYRTPEEYDAAIDNLFNSVYLKGTIN